MYGRCACAQTFAPPSLHPHRQSYGAFYSQHWLTLVLMLCCSPRSCKGSIFTYNGAYPDGTATQGGYSTHYVLNKK